MKIITSKSYKKKKISFVLVHGWEGGPNKDWFPWLNKKLVKDGYDVVNMSMPNSMSPKRGEWVKHLEEHIEPSRDIFFIAHSLAPVAVLKYLEKIDKKIKGAIFVAPYIINEQKYKTVSSFFNVKIDWSKVNKNCKKFFTIFSDDDPFVSLDQYLFMKDKTKVDLTVLHNRGHFSDDDNVKEIPELYEIIKKEIK
jgi:hypothetical protein